MNIFNKLFRKRKVSRSAETGRFVSATEVENNPDKTVTETIYQKKLNADVDGLVEKLKSMKFTDELEHPLENCVDFKKLVWMARGNTEK